MNPSSFCMRPWTRAWMNTGDRLFCFCDRNWLIETTGKESKVEDRSENHLYDTLLSCDQRFIPTAPFSPVRNELSHSSPSTWAYLWVVEKERDNVALVDEMWRELRHWFMSTTQCTGSVCCWKRDSVESKECVCVRVEFKCLLLVNVGR